MPKNPFSSKDDKLFKQPRNAFDLSHKNLFTTEFGKIYPILCQEVIPGDSFRIKASVGALGMPTVFPIQSNIRACCSFYYVRNRTLWKGWEDFIFKTKSTSVGGVDVSKDSPWLKPSSVNIKKQFGNGSLAEAFGLPSYVGASMSDSRKYLRLSSYYNFGTRNPYVFVDSVPTFLNDFYNSYMNLESSDSEYFYGTLYDFGRFDSYLSSSYRFYVPSVNVSLSQSVQSLYLAVIGYGDNNTKRCVGLFPLRLTLVPSNVGDCYFTCGDGVTGWPQTSGLAFYEFVNWLISKGLRFGFSLVHSNTFTQADGISVNVSPINGVEVNISPYTLDFPYTSNLAFLDFSRIYLDGVVSDFVKDATDDNFVDRNPFVVHAGQSVPDLPVSALPFRAYEMICNYYYRNDVNNPYYIGGEPQYNQFIPSYDGGSDSNLYTYHFKNWELDKFTSAVPSPQFGEAPLVGLTYRVGADVDIVTMSFQDTNGNTHTADVGVDSDTGKAISIVNVSDDMPSGNVQNLRHLVDAGFSINDLRTVNSFQRFLENVLRRGLRYRNQLVSHFGVNVDYPDIDVPQYLGGFSGYLNSDKTMSTAQTSEANVGDFVGQLGGSISSGREIDCYCPEHGFIIGVFYLEPIPVYTQSINPTLMKLHPFDYFQTEFGKIGHVPIHMSEVAPLQVALSASVEQDDVFGYQRAWYDYMQSLDEAHGDFRTSLKNWLLTRTFDSVPELMEDFVRINPQHLNNIWIDRNIADVYGSNAKFLCDASFKITAVRPIPRYGVPSLE